MAAPPSRASAGRSLSSAQALTPFTDEECHGLQHALALHLPPELLSTRSAFGGTRLTYLEGWRAIGLANKLFGFNGWSSQVIDTTVDFCDVTPDNRFSLGLSCTVRVTLKDGTFHEDIGYGSIDNARTKALAFEKAKKEAVTDAMKRALRMFGNCLGNCLYSKQYLRQIDRFGQEKPPPVAQSGLYRPHKHHIYSAYQSPPTDPHPAPAPTSPLSGNHPPQSPSSARDQTPSITATFDDDFDGTDEVLHELALSLENAQSFIEHRSRSSESKHQGTRAKGHSIPAVQSPTSVALAPTIVPTLRPASQLIRAVSPRAPLPSTSKPMRPGHRPAPAPPAGILTGPCPLPAAPFQVDTTTPGPQTLRSITPQPATVAHGAGKAKRPRP